MNAILLLSLINSHACAHTHEYTSIHTSHTLKHDSTLPTPTPYPTNSLHNEGGDTMFSVLA